jgi:hypothetical protein
MRGAEIPVRLATSVDVPQLARSYDGANAVSLSPAE